MIQVGAERAVAHMLAQAAVGGGDHAHVDPARPVRAQALDFAILQGAQQLGLYRQRQFSHFIEKQRAPLGRFETARPVADGAGKRTAHMAE